MMFINLYTKRANKLIINQLSRDLGPKIFVYFCSVYLSKIKTHAIFDYYIIEINKFTMNLLKRIFNLTEIEHPTLLVHGIEHVEVMTYRLGYGDKQIKTKTFMIPPEPAQTVISICNDSNPMSAESFCEIKVSDNFYLKFCIKEEDRELLNNYMKTFDCKDIIPDSEQLNEQICQNEIESILKLNKEYEKVLFDDTLDRNEKIKLLDDIKAKLDSYKN